MGKASFNRTVFATEKVNEAALASERKENTGKPNNRPFSKMAAENSNTLK